MDIPETASTSDIVENQTKTNYRYSATDEALTGVPIISMEDADTGIILHTAIANSNIQFPSVGAYAAARYSRSANSVTEIMAEIQSAYLEKGISAQQRLANIFRGYGHPSVGDMAQMMLYIEHLPLIDAANIFYQSAVQSGQERSTRYQDFSNVRLPDLNMFARNEKQQASDEMLEKYEGLKDYSLVMYRKYIGILTEAYTDYFKPQNKQEERSLSSRVFDSARYWLLSGFPTSAAYITSAREWSRIIGLLKGTSSEIDLRLGLQIENFLTPDENVSDEFGYMGDAPDLIRHTEPNSVVRMNLHSLEDLLLHLPLDMDRLNLLETDGGYEYQSVRLVSRKYTSGEILAAKYILSVYPNIEVFSLLDCLKKLPKTAKNELSKVIFSSHDRHNCLTEMGREGGMTMVLRMSLGEMRDMNRHRSMGKYSTILSTINPEILIDSDFTLPLYLSEIPELKPIEEEYIRDMEMYFSQLRKFYSLIINWDNYEILRYLLPLSTLDTFIMSGGPRELLYTADTRIRPGGHINYRDIAYSIATIASIDPYLSSIPNGMEMPDPNSREEFFDRS